MNIFKKVKNSPVEVKASFAYTVCSILQKSLSLITLPLFTRLLTETQYGQTTIYASWLAIFNIFITLYLPQGTFNKAMITFKDDRDGYIASVQTLTVILAAVFLIIYLPLQGVLNRWVNLPYLLIILMVLELIFSCAYSCWCGKNRYEYKYWSTIIVTLILAVVGPIVALILVLNFEEKGYARIIGVSAVTIIIGMVFFVMNYARGKKLFKKEHLKYAITCNVPLIAYYLSQMIFNQSDRLMIDYFCGTDKAGIYGVAYTLAMVLTFVVSAIGSAYVPWLYRKIEEKKPRDNRKVSCYIALIIAILLTFIIWLAPEAILILAGKNYQEAMWVVPPVAASLLLLLYTDFSNHIEFYYKKRLGLVLASIGSAIINIVLNAIFIPKWGFLVAGYTTLISYILFAVGNYLVIYKYVKKGAELHGIYNVKLLLIILLVFIGFSGLAMALYNYMYARLGVMLVAFILVIVFRKKIISVLKNLKSGEKSEETTTDGISADNETENKEESTDIQEQNTCADATNNQDISSEENGIAFGSVRDGDNIAEEKNGI